MTRILITGFSPFLGYDVNPTQRLVEEIRAAPDLVPGVAVFPRLLRTDYTLSEVDFDRALIEVNPDAVVAFGLAFSADHLQPERMAVNFDDGEDGEGWRSRRVAEDGPVGYWSTLPVDDIVAALDRAGLPVEASNHAGSYICNHIFYYARHRFEREGRALPMGFVHVPPLPEQLRDQPDRSGLPLDRLIEAARIVVHAVATSLRSAGSKAA
jgi:pyroglutamyl-peptidase